MTIAACEQLLVLLKHLVADTPEDEQVRRLSKGLVKALDRWLSFRRPAPLDQARSGRPRDTGLASVNASLVSSEEISHEITRQARRDPNR